MKILKIAEKWFFGTESNSSLKDDLKELAKFIIFIGLFMLVLIIGMSIGG